MTDLTICRHGETAWSLSGQHTGLTDIALTENGRKQAALLGARLKKMHFTKVFSSPLQRSLETCKIAGFKDTPIDRDLQEWDYGNYEGLTRAEIEQMNPHWNIFADGAPGGESIADVNARADRILAKLRNLTGNILIFSHGHFSRVLATCWLGLDVKLGKFLSVSPTSMSILGVDRKVPVIKLWNDVSHLY